MVTGSRTFVAAISITAMVTHDVTKDNHRARLVSKGA